MAVRKGLVQAAAAIAVLGAVGPALSATSAVDLFYDRAVMTAANGACHLFAPDVGAALVAGKAQARGAALRSGVDAASLSALEARADAAVGGAGCQSPILAEAAGQVRSAFAGYAGMDSMDFPGEFATWTAGRPAPADAPRWRLSQQDRFGWDQMTFGLVGHGSDRTLTAVARFADGAQPSGARLVMRDPTITSGPYLDARQADVEGRIPIDGRLPPRESMQVFQAVDLKPADQALAGRSPGAVSVSFPDSAASALAALDPREAVAIEFVFAGDDGEHVRTAYVEVGDFAAGRVFQSIDRR